MDSTLVRASKFLSLVLRHKPETIGLRLDPEGWAEVSVLIDAARAAGHRLDFDLLIRVVHENDKQRFSFSDDGNRVRANQGHSIDIDLGLAPIEPPTILFHGTVGHCLESIERQGLLAQSRQYVHLSSNVQTAKIVGARRGKPVVLAVDSQQMHEDNFQFFKSINGVWLTRHVPPKYLSEHAPSPD